MYEDFLYSRLSQLRIKNGVSARSMSLSLGQNPGYINDIENRKSLPSVSELFNICDFLDVTPTEFFDKGNNNPAKLNTIIEDMKSLSDEQLNNIAGIVKGLKKK